MDKQILIMFNFFCYFARMKNVKLYTDSSMVAVIIHANKCYDIVGNYFEDIWYKTSFIKFDKFLSMFSRDKSVLKNSGLSQTL